MVEELTWHSMPDSDPAGKRAERLSGLHQAFCEFIPHSRALNMQFRDFGPAMAEIFLPYDARLVGNPETGVLHGGAITALLDATSGASVYLTLPSPIPIATLDLRIDYLKPATPGQGVIARATCYKLTRNVAFTRALAFHEDESDPIASASGTFMLSTKGASAFNLSRARS